MLKLTSVHKEYTHKIILNNVDLFFIRSLLISSVVFSTIFNEFVERDFLFSCIRGNRRLSNSDRRIIFNSSRISGDCNNLVEAVVIDRLLLLILFSDMQRYVII